MSEDAVASLDDPRVAAYRLIGNHRALEAAGLFVVEGRLVAARLLALSAFPGRWAGAVQSLLVSPAALNQMRDVVESHPGVPVFVAPQHVMNAIVGFNIHRGCLGLARRPAVSLVTDEVIREAQCVVALDGVNNPDNVGGIFRSAAALGSDLVALGPSCADPLYRKSVRTSMGATLALPYARAEPWLDALGCLKRHGFVVAALTPRADACPLQHWHRDRRKVAFVAGAEGLGLSVETLGAADIQLTIPMTSRVDSLNVHTAVAIALYHAGMSRPA